MMKAQTGNLRLFASVASTFVVLFLELVSSHANAAIIISEFMAENSNGLRDEDGDRPDWIEVFNPAAATNLGGWFLTDSAGNLTKWRFPDVTLPPNSFLLIWASGKNRTNDAARLHANFRLEKNGEFLALVDPATNIVSAFSPNFPSQNADISYGRDGANPLAVGYFSNPTPGALNPMAGEGVAAEPILSLESGVYTNDSLTLTIQTAPNASVYYTLDGSVPAFGSALYAEPIVLSNNVTIKVVAYQPDFLPSPIVARTFVLLDASSRDFNSNLPLMILNAGGPVPAEVPPGGPRRNGGLIVIDNQTGRASLRDAPQFAGLAAFELFGQTSRDFPKSPHRIEVHDAAGRDLNVSLLGLPADADWQLQNPYDDKSFLNDFLGFELFEKMGRYASRRRFVEVFVDNGTGKLSYPQDYYGIMVLFEKIEADRQRVNIAELTPSDTTEPEITGGYIFKKDKDSQGDVNFNSPGGLGFLGIPLKLHEPKPVDVRQTPGSSIIGFPGPGFTPAGSNQLNYLRNYLGNMERALYTNDWLTQTGENHYSHYLDADSFVDQHWIVEFTKQIDGYRLSSFFTKDRGGKVKMEPIWGWKLSFGNADFAQGGLTNNWYYEITEERDHPWLRRLITGSPSALSTNGDPDFTQRIADRWSVLRTNVLNATNVNGRIRELAALLNEAAARDFAKYPRLGTYVWPNPSGVADGRDVDYVRPTNYFGATTNSIIGQMTKFVLGRYLWIDGQFTGAPVLSESGGMVTNGLLVNISAAPGATIYYTLDGSDPRAPGGSVAASAQIYSGPIAITSNARIVARAKKVGAWKDTWSGPTADTFYTALPPLRLTEIMYHPPGLPTDADSLEFIEVKNISGNALNVNGFTLGGGVQFSFPNVVLAGGQLAVVVKNIGAFQSRYGTSVLIFGEFAGQLDDSSARIILTGNLGEPIHDFTYRDHWHPATDGHGFSLVAVDDVAPLDVWRTAAGWRPSSAIGGSPGATDTIPVARPPVLINEALSHSELPFVDYIELHNPTAQPADISGWFLTDDFQTPRKYRVSDATIIPPNEFLVFDESHFNAMPGTSSNFTLNATGDGVFLFSGDGTNLTGHAHGFLFGPAAPGVSFGRHVTSIGEEDFVAQQQRTPGASNTAPLVGPVVISEIMFHPPEQMFSGDNVIDEFIELRNISANAVLWYDPVHPTNTWQVAGAVTFAFPPNTMLASGGHLLLVGFDPIANPSHAAAFRERNAVPENVPLFGPWIGHLSNTGGNIELSGPEVPGHSEENDGSSPIVVPQVLVDRVNYSSATPWPGDGDGLGLSLQRIAQTSYGNDPANWSAAAPTPGEDYSPGLAPTIVSQPASQNLIFGTNVVLAVEATGAPPLRYQWRFDNHDIPGATNASLILNNFSAENSGVYNVRVFNSGGIALSSNFVVAGRIGLQIVQQPVSHIVLLAGATNFTVVATAGNPIHYQWHFNGSPISAATNATLIVTNIQTTNEGSYTAIVSDGYDTLVTQPATLAIVFKPVWTLQPISQTAVEGASVTFTVAASGTRPIHFRWRTNGITFTNAVFVATPSNSSLTIHNLSTNFNGMRFDAAPTNIAGQGVLSANAFLTVLRDSDGDGLPDVWEQSRPGFNPNDPSDALRDDDGDGMTNRDEYIAGTDYLDPLSYLKVNLSVDGGAALRFMAVSNRTYTVQFSDQLGPAQWQKLADILAKSSNRVETVLDPTPATSRYYRLATPLGP